MSGQSANAPGKPVAVAVIALLTLVAGGALLINVYINNERERDLQRWESRLGVAADARAGALASFAEQNLADLGELAGNASLQLYLWQWRSASDAAGRPAETGQLSYLRNLLLAAAERYGLAGDPDDSRIPANLPQTRDSGLALLDPQLRPVVSTPGMPALTRAHRDAAARAIETRSAIVGALSADPAERISLAFAVPVGGVIGTGGTASDEPTGVLVAVRDAGREMFPLLRQNGAFAEANEALLLERRGDTVVYLSPTRDGSAPLRRSVALDRDELAAVRAVTAAGQFSAALNYQGQRVLQVSRQVPGRDWVVAQQVDEDQAMSESDARRRFLLTVLSLLLLVIAAIAVAAWRHGSSVRAREQAAELRDKALRLQRQTELLHAITGNLDVLTVLVAGDGHVVFSNEAAASASGSGTDAHGLLASVVGPDAARHFAEPIERVRREAATVHELMELKFASEAGTYQASLIPVERIGEHRDLVLIVLSDVTELTHAQERHERMLRNLVSTLMHVVDLHDPYSAHHSERMTEVANAIAETLGLDEAGRDTVDLAATLANIGKIMIPADVLTKASPLTVAEHALLRTHVSRGLDILRNLDFEGPVLDTIAQKQEHLDGSGYPEGLAGEQISLPGRILAVANAFVALVSPRAWRRGVSLRDALDQLMKDADTRYDRRVLAALFHVSENRPEWRQWQADNDPRD